MKRPALQYNECQPVDEDGLMGVKMYHAEPQESIQKLSENGLFTEPPRSPTTTSVIMRRVKQLFRG